ncbi:Zn-finger in Ran binding protein and others domain-containing protein [Toxoplasma gondii TgCatPRC2]|uniref:Zn-finger in Ran binding protein and others domain-containing protein n=12 Tax=Toxoplasma gondii TaxID=5811 RepID=V4Z5K8_TOXGV|nr:Zn-finger in Ran binding protein and others domain-containing protein [Toxoplasma gondii ME49]EPR57613.1 Zn-finger in Ran binding protein and others domain-containing protein [Toxoplasma gondii GT1]ESS29266.1 Zn-finger in Ran binding protein and others domain-containing protein [Toxoplasma gondii VEG]KAF4646114.1 Zn-finger in Ran binding protein and others domain-containing protein [Toxoplasma gondii]KFG35687.1 Zn-finger in Ran binding protein and others domain-containing protein [Toxoplasma|eukprot:XP_002370173.2 Zn-finger in Ran binding protein and others domain-containing protein [Toxoplasma gondii ME49]
MSPEVAEEGYGGRSQAPGATVLATVNSEKTSEHARQEAESPGDFLSGISTPQTLSGAPSFHPALGGTSETCMAPSSDSRGDSGVDQLEQSSMLYDNLAMNLIPLAISAASSGNDSVGGNIGSTNTFSGASSNGSSLLRDSPIGLGYAGLQDLTSLMIPSLNGTPATVGGTGPFHSSDVVASGAAGTSGPRSQTPCMPGTPHGGSTMAFRGNAREPPRMGEGGNWRCNNCSNINYPRRRACNRCGCARSAVNDLRVAEFTRLKDELQSMGLDSHTASQAAAAQQAAQQQGRLLSSMLDLLRSDDVLQPGGNRAHQAQNDAKPMQSHGLPPVNTRSGLCGNWGSTNSTDGLRLSGPNSSQAAATSGGALVSQLMLLNSSMAPMKIGTDSAVGAPTAQQQGGAAGLPSSCGSGGATLVTSVCNSAARVAGELSAAFDLKPAATEIHDVTGQTPGPSSLSFRVSAREAGFGISEDVPAIVPSVVDGEDATQYTTALQVMLLKAKDVADALVVYFQELGDPEPTSKAADVLRTALAMLGHSPDPQANDSAARESKNDVSGVPSASANSGIRSNSGSVRGIGGPNFSAPTMLAHPDEFKNPSSFLKIYGDPLCGSAELSSGNCQNPVKNHHGNWVCRNCKNVNFPRRFRCNKCGEVRDAEGDRIVAEYAKLVHHHHLKAYKHLASNPQGCSGA